MNIGLLGNRDSWYVADLERACRERGHAAERIDFRSLSASEGKFFREGEAPAESSQMVWSRPSGIEMGTCFAAYFPTWLKEVPWETRVGISGSAGASPSHLTDCDLSSVDALIVRTMPPGSLEQVVFRMDVLARMEARGVIVVNPPKAIECAVDKYLATSKLAAEGLPVPETIVCQDAEAAMEAFDTLGGDVVVKPLFGAEGRGIVRVSDPDLAFRTFRTLERIQAVLYLQRFVEHEGYDIRVLVLGGVVLGAFKRRNTSDFRTNMARAAIGEPHELTGQEHELAVKAVRVTGASFGGVDLLYDRCGPARPDCSDHSLLTTMRHEQRKRSERPPGGAQCYVLEVNAVPGWRGFRKVTGVDVAARLMEWLEVQVRAKR